MIKSDWASASDWGEVDLATTHSITIVNWHLIASTALIPVS